MTSGTLLTILIILELIFLRAGMFVLSHIAMFIMGVVFVIYGQERGICPIPEIAVDGSHKQE